MYESAVDYLYRSPIKTCYQSVAVCLTTLIEIRKWRVVTCVRMATQRRLLEVQNEVIHQDSSPISIKIYQAQLYRGDLQHLDVIDSLSHVSICP